MNDTSGGETSVRSYSDLPGPGLLELLKLLLYDKRKDPLKLFSALKQKYGSTFRLYVPELGGKALVISNPDSLREILLERQKQFRKPETQVTDDVRQIMGRGLITSQGEEWKKQHRLLMPHFQDQSVEQMKPLAKDEAEKLVERWSRGGFSQPFHLFRELKVIGLRFICRALFGHDMSHSDVETVRKSIDTLREAYRNRRTTPVAAPFWFPTPNNLRAKRARRKLTRFADRLINQRRAGGTSRDDLLGTLIDACDRNNAGTYTKKGVRAEIITFIIAGYTTTAAAMGWAIYELLKHPSSYERVRREANRARETGGPDEFSEEIPFTRAVFHETLRLYPTAPWIARSNKHDITVNGLRIPAGTTLILTPYLLHHDPDLFEDPEVFRPARFLSDDYGDSFAYLPFSVGAHQCIGREIALMEGPLVLSKIFAEGQIRRAPQTPSEVDIHTAVNIEPDRPIPVKYTRTNSQEKSQTLDSFG